jgi:hypothetical protein
MLRRHNLSSRFVLADHDLVPASQNGIWSSSLSCGEDGCSSSRPPAGGSSASGRRPPLKHCRIELPPPLGLMLRLKNMPARSVSLVEAARSSSYSCPSISTNASPLRSSAFGLLPLSRLRNRAPSGRHNCLEVHGVREDFAPTVPGHGCS